jgi:hypothetical protein
MEPETSQTKISSAITMILLMITFLGLIFKVYAYQEIRGNSNSVDLLIMGIFLANILKLCLYISMGILLLMAHTYNIRFDWIISFTVISGIITLFLMYTDWAALHDIFHGEPDTSLEWLFLRVGLIFNFLFCTAGFISIIQIEGSQNHRKLKKQ